jgi:hypothetical protein
MELLLNAPRYLAPILTAGFVAAILILPFFLDVKPAAGAPSFFAFQTRPFVPITSLFHFLEIRSQLVWNLGYLLALPLGYLAEFGVFFLGGLWWLHARREHSPELIYRDHMIVGLGAVSLIVPSFVWSGMEISNDLGYRGILPAQLLLLLCTAECIATCWHRNSPDTSSDLGARSHSHTPPGSLRHLFTTFLVVGIATNLLEIVILRGGIGTTSRDTIQVGEMFRPDTSAERLYALRDAYNWIRHNTPRTAVIQENPIAWQMVALGQYSERRTIVYGSNPSYMVGEDHSEYLKTWTALSANFANADVLGSACENSGLGFIVLQSGDADWVLHSGIPVSERMVFENRMTRVLRCENGGTR